MIGNPTNIFGDTLGKRAGASEHFSSHVNKIASWQVFSCAWAPLANFGISIYEKYGSRVSTKIKETNRIGSYILTIFEIEDIGCNFFFLIVASTNP